MSFEVQRVIAADHPSLPGHFPGHPIVPGVVILDEVARSLEEWQGGCQLTGIPAVKFIAPLRPDQPFTIRLTALDERQVQFRCTLHDQLLAQGRLEIDRGTRAANDGR